MTPEETAALERLRALRMAFPQAEGRESHGEPTWFVRGGRPLAMAEDVLRDAYLKMAPKTPAARLA